ncbi:MAG: hypothetical protein ACOH1P_05720 [Lysobacter sp.]
MASRLRRWMRVRASRAELASDGVAGWCRDRQYTTHPGLPIISRSARKAALKRANANLELRDHNGGAGGRRAASPSLTGNAGYSHQVPFIGVHVARTAAVAANIHGLYNSAASSGERLPTLLTDEPSVHDPMSAGRRLALRAIAFQAGATALTTLAFLAQGVPSALGALIGGGAVVAGGGVATLVALGGGVQAAGAVIGRLWAGVIVKWVVVFAVLALGLAGFKLPPLPMLVGVVATTLAFVLAQILNRKGVLRE